MIILDNVTKVFPGQCVALNKVNLTINDGEFVFMIGRSGAGKSTLAKLLIREEKLTDGSIIVNGVNISKLRSGKVSKYRRTIGSIFQEFRLFNDKTVYENVAFAMRVVGEPEANIKKRVPWLLELVGLTDKAERYPTELSGGQQQRVAIARAIANNPDIIIADEPTGNIDPEMSIEIMELLFSLNKLGKTIIVITHERALVNHYKQRVISINNGEVISDRNGGYDDEKTV